MKIQYGGGIVDARGSIAGNTASRNASGAYWRKRVAPVQPPSVPRTLVHSRLTQVSQAWRGLTANQMKAWAGLSSTFPAVDKLGNSIRYTPSQMYTRFNAQLLAAGASIISDAPTLVAVTNFTSMSFAAASAAATIVLTFAATPTPAGQKTIVLMTPPVSPGMTYVKNLYKQTQVIAGASATGTSLAAAWVAIYGAVIPAGMKLFVKLIPVVTATGQRGTPIESSAIIAA